METVKIGGINELSFIDSEGIGCSIFFQGCKHRCINCQNPELQCFDGGEEKTIDDIIDYIKKNRSWYDSVAFMGGEPLDQPESLKIMLKKVRDLGLKCWIYTGYEKEEIPVDLLALSDVIVAGAYIEELKTGGFPASSNQVIIRGDKLGSKVYV